MAVRLTLRRAVCVAAVTAVGLGVTPFVGTATALTTPTMVPQNNHTVGKRPVISATFADPVATGSITLQDKDAVAVTTGQSSVSADKKTISFVLTADLTLAKSPYTAQVVAAPTPPDATPYQGSWKFTADDVAPPLSLTTPPANPTTGPVTIGGTTEPNAAVSLRIAKVTGGTPTVDRSTTANASGGFTFADVDIATLPDETLRATVVASDIHGNSTTTTADFLKDTVVPARTATVPEDGKTSKTRNSVVVTYGEALKTTASSITVRNGVNSSLAGTLVFSNSNRTMTFTSDSPLAPAGGVFTIHAVASDPAGNVSTTTSTFTIDDTAPAPPSVFLTDPINQAKATKAVVSGVAEKGAKVDVSVDDSVPGGAVTGTGTAHADTGAYSIEVSVATLADGKLKATATATDYAGNQSTPNTSAESTLDTLAPAAPTATITDPISANRIAIVSGTAAADVTSLAVSVDDGDATTPAVTKTVVPGSGGAYSATLTLTGLKDGKVTASVLSYDAVGNPSATAGTDDAQLDTGLPAEPTLSMPTINDANKANVTATGTADPGTSVTIELTDGTVKQSDTVTASATGTFSKTFDTTNPAMSDGTLLLSATAKDNAGNESTKKTIQVVRDVGVPASPTVVLPQWVNNATQGAIELSGTAEPGSTLTIRLTDSAGTTVTHSHVTPPTGNWAKTVSFASFAQGAVTASVDARDAAQNTSATPGTAATTKDTLAPAAPSVTLTDPITPANVGTSVVSGNTEANSVVVVSVNDTDAATAAVPGEDTTTSGGTYSVPVDLASLTDGAISATATATDPAGNTSAAGSTAAPSTKDTTALAKTATSPVDAAVVQAPATVSVTFNEAVKQTQTTISLKDKTGAALSGAKSFTGTNTVVFTPADTLSDAASPYTVTWSAKDADESDTATGTFSFTVDTIAPGKPVVTLPVVNAANDDAVVVSGSAEPGSTVTVSVDDKTAGAPVSKTVPAGSGSWSVTLDLSGLEDGPLSASATAKDVAGNTSEAGTATSTKDALAPVKPSLSLPAYVNAGNAAAVPVSGTTDAGASVAITVLDRLDAPVTKTVDADETGTYATTLDLSGLADGALRASAVATDPALNSSDPQTTTSQKDVVVPLAPTVELSDPVNNANVTTATVSGVAEPDMTVLISIDDPTIGDPATGSTAADATTGAYSKGIDVSALADSTITATVTARDAAGNVSTATTDTATKDATVPAQPTVAFGSAANLASQVVTFSGAAERGSSLTLSVDDTDDVTSPVTHTLTVPSDADAYSVDLNLASLSDGTLTASAVVTDTALNVSPAGTAQGLKDVVAPAAATVSLPDPVNAAGQAAVVVSGVAEKGATVNVVLDDTVSGGALTSSDVAGAETGAYDVTFDVTALADGPITATATVVDPAGNSSASASDTAQKDATAPAAPSVDLTDPINAASKTSVTVSGVAEPGSQVAISVDDETAGDAMTATTTADLTSGAYSVPFDVTELADGTLTATVTAADVAGNVSPAGTDTSEKDSTLPEVPTLSTPAEVTRATRAAAPFSGTAEPASTVTVTADDADAATAAVSGTTITQPDGTWSLVLDLTSLKDGTLSIAVTATDAVSNTSGTTSGSVAKNVTRAFTVSVPATPKSGEAQAVTVTAHSTYRIDSPADATYVGTPALTSDDGHTAAGNCSPAVNGVATCTGTTFGDLGTQTLRAAEGTGEDRLEGASTVVVQPVALVYTVAPPATASPNQPVTFTVAPTAGVPGASIDGYSATRKLVSTGGTIPNTDTTLSCAQAVCQVSVTFVSRGVKTVKVVDNGSPALSTPTATVNIPYGTALSLYRSHTVVNAGSQALIIGELVNTTTLQGVAGKRIEIWRKVAPATTYSKYTSVATDEDGVWFKVVTVSKNTSYQVRFGGDAMHVASRSAVGTIKAAYVVSSTWSKSGRTVKATGRVSPNAAGRPVYLQYRKADGTWAYAGVKTTVSSTGTYTVRRTLAPGKWTLRVAVSGTSVYASGYSRSFGTTVQ